MSASRSAIVFASTAFLASAAWFVMRGDSWEAGDHKSPVEAETSAEETSRDRKNAGQEQASPVAAVAGDYYFGDGTGVNCSMAVKQEGRFSFTWRGCLGVYDENEGRARIEAQHLIIEPERPNVREGFRGTPNDFNVVRWGDRLYLVPDSDGLEFCNQVNQGTEPRDRSHGNFYLRAGDWKKEVTGKPGVPEAWKRLLLEKPVVAKVIETMGDNRARIDLGGDSGLWEDMELWAETEGFGLVQVVEVGPTSCVIATKYPDLDTIRFREGQVVRSRALAAGR